MNHKPGEQLPAAEQPAAISDFVADFSERFSGAMAGAEAAVRNGGPAPVLPVLPKASAAKGTARKQPAKERRKSKPAPAAHPHAAWWGAPPRNLPAAPALLDMLPPDVLTKLADLWRLTGSNVLYWQAHRILNEIEDITEGTPRTTLDCMEADWLERIENCRIRWERREKSAGGGKADAKGKEAA